jgi:hypothetical protein
MVSKQSTVIHVTELNNQNGRMTDMMIPMEVSPRLLKSCYASIDSMIIHTRCNLCYKGMNINMVDDVVVMDCSNDDCRGSHKNIKPPWIRKEPRQPLKR